MKGFNAILTKLKLNQSITVPIQTDDVRKEQITLNAQKYIQQFKQGKKWEISFVKPYDTVTVRRVK